MNSDTIKKITYWLKIFLMMFVLFLASLAILRTSIVHDHFPELKNEKEKVQRLSFPDLELIDLEGHKKNISDFKGSVLLVSFWASWCAPCIEELPLFAKLAMKYPQKLKVIAINQDDSANVRKFVDNFWPKHKIPFKTYFDPNGRLAQKVGVDVLPTNFVLDKEGQLVFTSRGAIDWNAPDALSFLEDLMQEI